MLCVEMTCSESHSQNCVPCALVVSVLCRVGSDDRLSVTVSENDCIIRGYIYMY